MADYISSLTGQQMDSALMDMAEHTSEAYAIGKRNGTEVPSTDPTYHNNSKYYCEQAGQIASGMKNEFVETLPTVGENNVRYFVLLSGTTYTVYVWVDSTQSYQSLGTTEMTGDMMKSVYDSTNAVATAGGIVPYVDANGGKIDHIQVNGTEQTITDKTVNLVVDATPTSGSNNPVQSGGVKDALDTLDSEKQDLLTFDNTPTAGSNNPVKSSGIKSYTDTQDGKRTRNNITNNLANLLTAIAEQNLEKYGYAIGDYFVGASGYKYHLADMDTYYGGYNSYAVVGTHHCGVVVDTLSTCQWQSSGNAPRYDSSTLHTYLTDTALPNIKNDITALFGDWSSHLISHEMLANGIGTWGWSGANYIRAMSEVEVYSSKIWSADNYQQGEAVKPLTLFQKFRFNEIYGNTWIWLRSLYSASNACNANAGGVADYIPLTASCRASGLILLH